MDTSKRDVRGSFKSMREMMRQANAIMKEQGIQSFDNGSEAGQLANELVACSSIFSAWVQEMNENPPKARKPREPKAKGAKKVKRKGII
jgi:adenylyl- and sulfurtransferase ThiI